AADETAAPPDTVAGTPGTLASMRQMRIGLLKAHEQNLILLYPALASARNPPVSIGTRPSAEIPYSCENPVVVQFPCHPEQAFFAQRRIWASRAKRRV